MSPSQPTPNVKKCMLAAGVLCAVSASRVATAGLGDVESSVQSDVARMHGSIKVTEHASYRVHEIQLPSGTVVREFAGPDGKVFAVSWNGPSTPNLSQALGAYFTNYTAAAKADHSGHRHLHIQQPDLVVEAGGHMRAFSGFAYLPQAVPSGVSIGNLR